MRRVYLLAMAVMFAVGLFAPAVSRAEELTCFPETDLCVGGRFRDYWQQNGGLAVFGYPVGEAIRIKDESTGDAFVTQFFERNSFELHPENKAPYDVLLGRLGADMLELVGVDWQKLPREAGPKADCIWFEQTGHNVCNNAGNLGFKSYWSSHGLEFDGKPGKSYGESLALFGMPLTGVVMDENASGDQVLMQWFERGRFEWHPDKPDEYKVLLGLLGNEILDLVSDERTPEPEATQPAPSNDPCANIAAPRSATIEPACVKFGEQFYVEVRGFKANEQIGFWITDGNGITVGTNQTIGVDKQGVAGGELDTTDYFGLELGPGDYVFVAQDPSGKHKAVAPFRVVE